MKPEMIGANQRPCTPGGFFQPTNRKRKTGTLHIRQAANEALIRHGVVNTPCEMRDGFTFGANSPARVKIPSRYL